MVPVVVEPPEEKWDCETIISESQLHLNSGDPQIYFIQTIISLIIDIWS